MEIIPAIDIIDGKCVRLTQGDYGQKKIYNEKPLEVAKEFEDAGLRRLHIVDLDGAKNGKVTNLKVLETITSKTGGKFHKKRSYSHRQLFILFSFSLFSSLPLHASNHERLSHHPRQTPSRRRVCVGEAHRAQAQMGRTDGDPVERPVGESEFESKLGRERERSGRL